VSEAWSAIVVWAIEMLSKQSSADQRPWSSHRLLQTVEVEAPGAEQVFKVEQHVTGIGGCSEVPPERPRDLRRHGQGREFGIGGQRARAVVDGVANGHEFRTVRHVISPCSDNTLA